VEIHDGNASHGKETARTHRSSKGIHTPSGLPRFDGITPSNRNDALGDSP